MSNHKPRWRIVPRRRNAFGQLLYQAVSPLGRIIRLEPFLSIPDAMKAIAKKFNENA